MRKIKDFSQSVFYAIVGVVVFLVACVYTAFKGGGWIDEYMDYFGGDEEP